MLSLALGRAETAVFVGPKMGLGRGIFVGHGEESFINGGFITYPLPNLGRGPDLEISRLNTHLHFFSSKLSSVIVDCGLNAFVFTLRILVRESLF